ncbi:hypothetical protein D7Y27_21385 [Corallococcus sp. AB004]|uniref:hypothetical protein n=1 Tax=Corallococcus TaxID=83461 RepID=UPI000EA368F1|nr:MULTISPECIES: hypothetical protein [Corallococcus]NPC72298.1 hypothetical protein [Corallococcus exiguus]RKI03495.1 hypothetical protein D7Y04_00440 [Corallococcus sp. AB038B]RKI39871.1 hypothetical protein D7Y27_21385 [Corallococcus sp. AB004]
MSALPSSSAQPRSWVFVVLGAIGLTLSALACAALMVVLDFAWSEAPPSNASWELEVPPPVYGPLPSLTLRDERGQPLEPGQLQGQLTLIQFTLAPLLRQVQERLEADGVPLRVVIATSRDSTVLHPDWQPLRDSGRLLLLVDQRLQVRGVYDSSQTPSTSERVITDARCLRSCPPL